MNPPKPAIAALPVLFLSLSAARSAPAQVWDSARVVAVVSDRAGAEVDYPIFIQLYSDFDYGNAQAGGEDVRVATDEGGQFCVPLWVEKWNSTGSSFLWVAPPEVPAGSSSLYFFYGNPAALPVSSFAEVFPDARVVADGEVLSGELAHGSFEIPASATVTLSPGAMVRLEARRVILRGTIDGFGAGYEAGAPGAAGGGPGGGGVSPTGNAGAGGGGLAGEGGSGGFDTGETPGAGGPSTFPTGFSLDLGAGGGSSDDARGGNGGGALWISAERLQIDGTIDLRGHSADQPGPGLGGGGGAGGGLLLHGYELFLTGAVFDVTGGDGSNGSNAADDSGGGGGGGIVKLLYERLLQMPALMAFQGGLGGPNGQAAPAENGVSGGWENGFGSNFHEVLTTVGDAAAVSLPQLCTGLFRDGFESGDTSRWSASLPAGRSPADAIRTPVIPAP